MQMLKNAERTLAYCSPTVVAQEMFDRPNDGPASFRLSPHKHMCAVTIVSWMEDHVSVWETVIIAITKFRKQSWSCRDTIEVRSASPTRLESMETGSGSAGKPKAICSRCAMHLTYL